MIHTPARGHASHAASVASLATSDPAKGRTVVLETLGCKLNQYETDAIATELSRRGYAVANRAEGLTDPTGDPGAAGSASSETRADAYVINSCTVTNKADRKSRNTLNRAVRNAGQDGVVILTGCFVDSHRELLQDSVATYVVDNAHKNTIPEILDAHFRGEVVDPNGLDPNVFGFAPPARIFHTRSNIKIQDGCDNFCTFCIIPFVRGRARSRPPQDVLTEAQEAIRGGAREIVLTGVNMSRYQPDPADTADFPGTEDFAGLLAALLELSGEYRLRISSLEPDTLDERFVELFRHPRMCPHLHLCLQSGSDRILLAMRRMYTVGQYLEVVDRLRAIDPNFTVTTDLIVGFPGEGESEFSESLAVAERADIAHVHMFPYSVRTGTRAERMPNHVGSIERSRRGRIVQEQAAARKRRIRERQIGTRQRVLVERIDIDDEGQPWARGLSEYYHPVVLPLEPADAIAANTFVDVGITAVRDGNEAVLIGRP